MRTFAALLTGGLFIALCAPPVTASLVNVYTDPDPAQDDWTLTGPMHEVGNRQPFDASQWMQSGFQPWDGHVPCPSAYQGGDCIQIWIRNKTSADWTEVYYVADPETSLTNYDEWVGNAGLGDATPAFRIDAVGENTPLVSESMAADGILQAGETWEFVVQDYSNANTPQPGPHAFGSIGIASLSSDPPPDQTIPSTASIIAAPEPAALALLAAGAVVLIRRRRRWTSQSQNRGGRAGKPDH